MTGTAVGAAQRALGALFAAGEWPTERTWLSTRPDPNPFMTANIALILERCGEAAAPLSDLVDQAHAHLATYRVGHQAYYWPVHDSVAIASAPPLVRRRWVEMSPDADDSCLVQLVRRDAGMDEPLLEDLAFYRADGDRFRLPAFQRSLPGVSGSFLTWFPPRERCHSGKLETVDLAVHANILWYLGTIGRLDVHGAAETVRFVVETVRSGLVVREPFKVSTNYPKPIVLLYLVARAAAWGDIPELLALKAEILAQVDQCPAHSSLERLCRAAARRLCGAPGEDSAGLPTPTGEDAFYIAPLLAWPLQRFAPLEALAAQPATHLRFKSAALEWALYLWLQSQA